MQALESSVCSRDPRRPRARAHVRRCRILCIGCSRVLSAASHSSGCALIPLQTSFSSFVSRPCGRIGSTFDYHRGTLFRMMVSLDDSFEVHEGEGCNVAFTHVGKVSVRSSSIFSFFCYIKMKYLIHSSNRYKTHTSQFERFSQFLKCFSTFKDEHVATWEAWETHLANSLNSNVNYVQRRANIVQINYSHKNPI